MPYLRVNAHKSVEVPVSASDYWDILIDWAALMSWIPKLDENPPAPVSGCEVLPGQDPAQLPFTRRVHLQNEDVGPAFLDEVLQHFDADTKRLYYTFDGIGPAGVRNYHATTFVDDLGPGRCRVTCASQYDIPDDAGTDMKDFIQEFYDRAIIQGIARLIQTRAG